MQKVYFKDEEKLPILKSLSVMANIATNLKNPMQLIDREKTEEFRKIFIKEYSNYRSIYEPQLALKLAEKANEIGFEVDIEKLTMNCVFEGLIEKNMLENMTTEQLTLLNKSKEKIRNSYVFDFIYEYLEENLKKVITSELFKRIYALTFNLNINIKVSSERLEEIFKDESIKNKENFFCQQFQTWAIYNQIIPFAKCEIKQREEQEKKDIFINITILKYLFEKNKN